MIIKEGQMKEGQMKEEDIMPEGIGPEGTYCPKCGQEGKPVLSFSENIGEFICINWECSAQETKRLAMYRKKFP